MVVVTRHCSNLQWGISLAWSPNASNRLFSSLPTVSPVNACITILPTLPGNKAIGPVTYRLPHQILAIVNEEYESGLTLQDTGYAASSPFFLPYSEAHATTEIAFAPESACRQA
jgi:hypothetical protein